ncbi:PREDICTED: uncharacterized protein LOC104763339 [Camelina sativa]|uniref:Uncharacterized protein LOC104763339 n=1 Tax=Camelina sativa TaxID=90675 RepID=A0ABM0XF43_CAMSA|nr:PREDICTED: uncharacterized protein LOC104763339 [Camelina sativa]
MGTIPVNLPTHEHPLFPSARNVAFTCKGCHVEGIGYGGYKCNDYYCNAWFHKECAEAPSEISHPSHPQHQLSLTNDHGDHPCDLCGQKFLSPCYSCSTCQFALDLACGIRPSPFEIENPICHDHSLVFLKKKEEEASCEVCKDSIAGPSYSCLECDVYFHVDCVNLSKEVNHPCHPVHPLMLMESESLPEDAKKTCIFCEAQPENVLYHCSFCNFSTCLACSKNPPPIVMEHTKTHKHPLTLFSREISFTCNACGIEDNDMKPYMCLQCDFVVHGICIGLPQVININRHDHRISCTHHLGHANLICGVCRKSVSQFYGGYSCSSCPNYTVHSQCAVKTNVWDGVELEGVPEDEEDIAPYKVVGDDLICHFSHEKHTLRFYKDNIIHDGRTRCEACSQPVEFDPIYSCEDCCFILHEKCANHPLKKRLVFSTRPFKLQEAGTGVRKVLDCAYCRIFSTGFEYTSLIAKNVDVHCGSLSEPFIHDDGHLHPLYFDTLDPKQRHNCNGCRNRIDGHLLRCEPCIFDLCLSCASLPKKIRHSSDEHPLTLFCGGKTGDKYWCDICERELDPKKWFYTCSDCGVTMHVECVIGDFSRLMPGSIIDIGGYGFEVVLNNHNTRPLCRECFSRCKVSVILKDLEDNEYICSRLCFLKSPCGISYVSKK